MATESTIEEVKPKRQNKSTKSISQPIAIKTFYDKTCQSKISFKEDEEVAVIIEKCQASGHFFFRKEDSSSWYFVKSKSEGKHCIRMIFLLSDGEGGKVHNVEKITKLIANIEEVLVFVESNKVYKQNSFSVLDVVKIEE